jgi:hypothetical protein
VAALSRITENKDTCQMICLPDSWCNSCICNPSY